MNDVTTSDADQGGAAELPGVRVGRRAYLETTVADLFGTPSGISPAGRSMALLPNATHPSLAVPRRPRRAAAGAVRLYKSSAGRGTRLGLELLALGLRLGAVDLLPRLDVGSPGACPADPTAPSQEDDIAGFLSSRLGQEVAVAVYSSPPRANRKPVLHVLDRRGRPLAYAKIGNTPLSRELVVREAATLAALRDTSPSQVVLPALILVDRWREMDVMLVEPVRFSSRRPSDTTLVEAMRATAEVGGISTHELATSPYVVALRTRLAGLPPGDAATALAHQLELLVSLAAGTMVSLGSWHGDWTPWNCSRAGDRVALWDWERFTDGVPVGFDRLHYSLQDRIVRHGQPPTTAARDILREADRLLAPLGVAGDDAPTVARLYLVELGVRYLQDLQDRTGGPNGDVGAWLVPALRDSMPGRAHEVAP